MTPSRRAGLCVLLSLAHSSGDIVEPADAPVTVTPGTYYKYTEKFSVITKDDCHIAAHDTYTSVAVGGNDENADAEPSSRSGSRRSYIRRRCSLAGLVRPAGLRRIGSWRTTWLLQGIRIELTASLIIRKRK